MKTVDLKCWILLLLGVLILGSCGDGELEGDLYPVGKGEKGEENNKEYVGDLIASMVRIPEGTFLMGNDGEDAREEESPVHLVTLDAFYISKYCVTQGLYKEIMGNNPSTVQLNYNYYPYDQFISWEYEEDYPVTNVSYSDCLEFIRKLNDKTGKNFALPTEAQWELAARGEYATTYPSSYTYASSSYYYQKNSSYTLHGVGAGDYSYQNAFGLYHMSGNVKEWVADWMAAYSEEAEENPTGPSSGVYRVFRGGSCASPEEECRVTYRFYNYPSTKADELGFRLVVNGSMNGKVSPKKLEFEKEGGSKNVMVETSVENISCKSNESWCNVTYKKESSIVEVTVGVNIGKKRIAAIEVILDNEKEIVTVVQEGIFLEIVDNNGESCDTLRVDGNEASFHEFTVKQSGTEDWSVQSLNEWCTVEKNDEGFSVSVTANSSRVDSRLGLVIVSSENMLQDTLWIFQEKNEGLFSILYNGEDVDTLRIDGNEASFHEFTVKQSGTEDWSVQSLNEWCTVEKNDEGFSVSVTANSSRVDSRLGLVIVSSENMLQDTLWIFQEKNEGLFSILYNGEDVDTLRIDGNQASFHEFTVKQSMQEEWSVQSLDEWCTVEKNGEGFSVSVTINPSRVDPRLGQVIVSSESMLRDTLWIVQGVSRELFSIRYEGEDVDTLIAGSEGASGTLSLVKENSDYWFVESSASWCHVVRSGSNIDLTVDAYSGEYNDRKAYIRAYTSNGLADTVWVVQKKKINLKVTWSDIYESASVYNCKEEGGYRDCRVETKAKWTVTSGADWCIVTNQTTTGFRIIVNECLQQRETYVEVDAEGVTHRIAIRQNKVVGSLYDQNGIQGIIWQLSEDGKSGKIVSLQEEAYTWSSLYGYTYANSISDGEVNMQKIWDLPYSFSKWPAFEWCYNYSGDGKWYLPAKDELVEMFVAVQDYGSSKFNQLLASYGGNEFSSSSEYWSSTEYDYEWAYTVNKSGTVRNNVNKKNQYRVRAIRKVTFE